MKLKYHIPTKIKIFDNPLFVLIMIMISLIFIAYTSSAASPVLSINTNSKTNTNSSYGIFLNSSESIIFTATTTDPLNTWNWYKDNILQSNNFNNFTTSFITGSYHYIKVNSNNDNGISNNISWGINTFPEMATSPTNNIQLLNETPANNFELAISNNSLPELVSTPIQIYINFIGLSFYAFIWFIVFAMLWIKQSSINIPAIIGIIFGGLIITFLPAQYQLVSQVFIVFGIFAVIYIFFKGRG